MTNQEINERVAKLCGWKPRAFCVGYYRDDFDGYALALPNYTESLDACREFEAAITGDDRSLYLDHIYLIVIQSNNNAVMGFDNQWAMFNATPLQRCKSFLRLKGQWE